eukprot:CAMPEP_0178990490 /NCGR_PEP_ID=MMETSP0795-20121207/4983_1 /TAXON_ID=88552 /ORGANISM="Amoebophrya sp., Strain Ameob2" /LENGTH=159 /DNA_ID=CAMNT_0020682057 /DNA_START=355 /DNA_END=831 /DNA_ORIENTATION=-
MSFGQTAERGPQQVLSLSLSRPSSTDARRCVSWSSSLPPLPGPGRPRSCSGEGCERVAPASQQGASPALRGAASSRGRVPACSVCGSVVRSARRPPALSFVRLAVDDVSDPRDGEERHRAEETESLDDVVLDNSVLAAAAQPDLVTGPLLLFFAGSSRS